MKRKNPLKVATPEFRSLIRLCPPRPQRSPPMSRTSDVCVTRGFIAANVWTREERWAGWGIEFQSMRVNLTPGWAFPWSDVYSWFASLPTPNTWTHKQKEIFGNKTKMRIKCVRQNFEPPRQTDSKTFWNPLSSWRSQKDSLVWVFSLIF